MSFDAALASASSRSDVTAFEQLASGAINSGEEERALPLLAQALKDAPSARLWQLKGLLERSIDEHARALDSLAEAAKLDPANRGIARWHAVVALEAGLDARQLYEHALSLAPKNGDLLIGIAKARAAVGDTDDAIAGLSTFLEQAPGWTAGYEQLAQLLAAHGRAHGATAPLERALQCSPSVQQLWETLLYVQLRRGAYERLKETVERARSAGISSPEFRIYEGIHAAEFDPATYPSALFDRAEPAVESALDRWRVRHLLRVGALDAVLPLIDRLLLTDRSAELYAYTATAWRLAGDPRSEWLEGDERLVQIFDLTNELPPFGALADTLRALHVGSGEYLYESVRGGTQTEGPLFNRIDPAIRQLRQAAVGAVEKYVAQLPATDRNHPLLRERRDRRTRFSGSWSVCLRGGGRHANHVHPQGWISSALYVSLPERSPNDRKDAGWFTLGAPDESLGLSLSPWRKIEPKPGHLILFPSWMWHGTVPFAKGERLTVAFDVAVPR